MALFESFLALLCLVSSALAGCRYTNPEWNNEVGSWQGTAPTIALALTSSDFELTAKWNASLVTRPQCVDKINLFAIDNVSICRTNLTLASCQSDDLESSRTKLCEADSTRFWLSLTNKDHKDGIQTIRAPAETLVKDLCTGSLEISIERSQSCEAKVPEWTADPEVEIPRGRRGLRYIYMKWRNEIISGVECTRSFEIKYWPIGQASSSFVTSEIKAKRKDNKDYQYSESLEIEECEEYIYEIRVMKDNPSLVVVRRGNFKSKCRKTDNNNNAASTSSSGRVRSQQVRTTRRPRKTSTTTRSTTTTTTTTTSRRTTRTTTRTTTTTTTRRVTTIKPITTSTTRLSSLLFGSEATRPTPTRSEVTTMKGESLEDMLFKGDDATTTTTRRGSSTSEAEPRTPKKTDDDDGGRNSNIDVEFTTSKSDDINKRTTAASSKKVNTTYNVQGDQPPRHRHDDQPHPDDIEYHENGVEEDRRYLETAVGLDENKKKTRTQANRDRNAPEADGEPEYSEDYGSGVTTLYQFKTPPSFDELLEKNPRSLPFDEDPNSGANALMQSLIFNTAAIFVPFMLL